MNNQEMNSNEELSVTTTTSERLDSVNIHDLEAQNQSNDISSLEVPLKGILRKPEVNLSSNDSELVLLKICGSIVIFIIMVPIIVADLYFGFTDNSCINEEPKNLAISMKLYLLVSGFTGLGAMVSLIFGICSISKDEEKTFINLCCTTIILWVIGVFHVIWNILGAIVFWGTIYDKSDCTKNVSTYIFVSLIIKLVGCLGTLCQKKENKK